MLPVDPKKLFDAIPDAVRSEWARGRCTLDQACPRVKHETSAIRNELIRLLSNWWAK